MCASRRRRECILGNVQNNYRNMTDYTQVVPRHRRRADGQKFDDDVRREGDGCMGERRRCRLSLSEVFLQMMRFVLHTSTHCRAKLKLHSLRNVKPV